MNFINTIQPLRNKSGVYALSKDKNIIYVGSSKNMYIRLLEHKADNTRGFDSIHTVCLANPDINDTIRKILEMGVICEIKPKTNQIIFDNFIYWLYSIPCEDISKSHAQKISHMSINIANMLRKGGHYEY